ncbi:MAG: hypothetical protein WBD83_23000, partial [Xanthobacteraceae bacterium]
PCYPADRGVARPNLTAQEFNVSNQKPSGEKKAISRDQLADLLSENLSRERSRSAPRKKQWRCCGLISRTKTRRSAITASESDNAKPSVNSPRLSRFRRFLIEEQDHQIDLATAPGEDVPDVGKPK